MEDRVRAGNGTDNVLVFNIPSHVTDAKSLIAHLKLGAQADISDSDTAIVPGTPLNAQTLLRDSTAQTLGLYPKTATVADVIDVFISEHQKTAEAMDEFADEFQKTSDTMSEFESEYQKTAEANAKYATTAQGAKADSAVQAASVFEITTAANDTVTASGTITNLLSSISGRIKALLDRFNPASGHAHNGNDSPKIDYADILNAPSVGGAAACPYDIGDIYQTISPNYNTVAKVEARWPGTFWEVFAPGRTLVSADAANTMMNVAEKVFGRADAIVAYHTHVFTGTAMGAHNHAQSGHRHEVYLYGNHNSGSDVPADRAYWPNNWNWGPVSNKANIFSGMADWTTATNIAASAGTPAGTNAYAGTSGNMTNANYQPSVAVYMYVRIESDDVTLPGEPPIEEIPDTGFGLI